MFAGWSWSWWYGSWIYNYLFNQSLSTLKLWNRSCSWRDVLDTTLCDKLCQLLATGRWFSASIPVPLPIYYWNIVASGIKHSYPLLPPFVCQAILVTHKYPYRQGFLVGEIHLTAGDTKIISTHTDSVFFLAAFTSP